MRHINLPDNRLNNVTSKRLIRWHCKNDNRIYFDILKENNRDSGFIWILQFPCPQSLARNQVICHCFIILQNDELFCIVLWWPIYYNKPTYFQNYFITLCPQITFIRVFYIVFPVFNLQINNTSSTLVTFQNLPQILFGNKNQSCRWSPHIVYV